MRRDAINKSLEVLKSGGILLTPTDTIWGLGCDAGNQAAVEKLIRLKQRPPEKSFIILMEGEHMLEQYLREVPAVAYDLIEYAEKPLTIVFPGARYLAPGVIHRDGSVGIRIVKRDCFCRDLLRRFRRPMVSTSANLSGRSAPAGPDEVDPALLRGTDYIVPAREGLPDRMEPSTIVRLGPGGEYSLIRK